MCFFFLSFFSSFLVSLFLYSIYKRNIKHWARLCMLQCRFLYAHIFFSIIIFYMICSFKINLNAYICIYMPTEHTYVYSDNNNNNNNTTAPMSVMEALLLKYRMKYMISSCLYLSVWPYTDFSI